MLMQFLMVFVFLPLAGRQTVIVHHQTGIAAITVTAVGYQASHLAAANVPSRVSENQQLNHDEILMFSLPFQKAEAGE